MSSLYRPYRQRYYYSEEEIDFTAEYIDYSQFLLHEFFTANIETRKKLSEYYLKVYGTRSFSYLRRKYSEWSRGDYHLTENMRYRILSFMPMFLSESAKHKIGIHEYVASIKKAVRSFEAKRNLTKPPIKKNAKIDDLKELFHFENCQIEKVQLPSFHFNILTEEEKNEALEVIKYILKTKLQIRIEQIQRDFKVFYPFVADLKSFSNYLTYHISSFPVIVNLKNESISYLDFNELNFFISTSNSKYKSHADKYLAYELVSINAEQNKAVSEALLNENDLNLFLNYYRSLYNNESEVQMTSKFQGEGGQLHIKVEFQSPSLLRKLMFISSLKLLLSVVVAFSFYVALQYFKYAPILLLVGFYSVFFLFDFVSTEIKSLSSNYKQFSSYGKQQSNSQT